MRDRLAHVHRDTSAVVVITGAQFHCTKCEQWKPASEFGMRSMPNGNIRNQPQCIKCRKAKGPWTKGRPGQHNSTDRKSLTYTRSTQNEQKISRDSRKCTGRAD